MPPNTLVTSDTECNNQMSEQVRQENSANHSRQVFHLLSIVLVAIVFFMIILVPSMLGEQTQDSLHVYKIHFPEHMTRGGGHVPAYDMFYTKENYDIAYFLNNKIGFPVVYLSACLIMLNLFVFLRASKSKT